MTTQENKSKQPINVTPFSDYLCPWCYVTLVRLHRLRAEYGSGLRFTWKSFPLRPYAIPALSPGKLNRGMAAAAAEEKSIPLRQWPESLSPPATSIPALAAAKCAQLQGTAAFERYQLALFKAYFEQSQDISQTAVLFSLAREAKLDMAAFIAEFNAGKQKETIWTEFDEARDTLPSPAFPPPFSRTAFASSVRCLSRSIAGLWNCAGHQQPKNARLPPAVY